MTEYLGEFIGTMILILFGGGVVASLNLKKSNAEKAGWVNIPIAWGLAVAFAVFAVGNISGAHINPAVTLGFAIVGEFEWMKKKNYLNLHMQHPQTLILSRHHNLENMP